MYTNNPQNANGMYCNKNPCMEVQCHHQCNSIVPHAPLSTPVGRLSVTRSPDAGEADSAGHRKYTRRKTAASTGESRRVKLIV